MQQMAGRMNGTNAKYDKWSEHTLTFVDHDHIFDIITQPNHFDKLFSIILTNNSFLIDHFHEFSAFYPISDKFHLFKLLFILHIAYCIFVCENCGPEYFLPSIESSSNKGNPVLPSFMLY
jgi:hypothetical protein